MPTKTEIDDLLANNRAAEWLNAKVKATLVEAAATKNSMTEAKKKEDPCAY